MYPILDVDIEKANTEWQIPFEVDTVQSMSEEDLLEFWKTVARMKNSMGQPMFPNLIEVVKFVFTFPHSSATCERAFSELNLVKTKTRNKLLMKTCEAVMQIKDQVKNGDYNYKTLGKRNFSENEEEVFEEDVF